MTQCSTCACFASILPRRPDEAAAKEDLESMRAAASGMSREDGFAAMKVEADALKAGKPPKEVGFIDRDGNVFRARVQYREEGAKRDIRTVASRRSSRKGRSPVHSRRRQRHEPCRGSRCNGSRSRSVEGWQGTEGRRLSKTPKHWLRRADSVDGWRGGTLLLRPTAI